MNELISEKFEACTSFSPDVLQEIVSTDRFKRYRQKFKMDDFREKLIPHKMEEFSELLYFYLIFKLEQHDSFQKNRSRYSFAFRQNLVFQEELVLSLKELLSGGQLRHLCDKISTFCDKI